MRLISLPLLLLPILIQAQQPVRPASQGIDWISIEEAQARVKKAPKPIMVDVYTNWCGPCKMLDRNTFGHARLAEYVNKHFYAVKFNAEGGEPVTFKGQTFRNPSFNPQAGGGRNGTHEFTMAIGNVNGRIAYPTLVYLNEELEVIAPVQGYMTPSQIEPILRYIGEGAYKKQEYQSFQAGFKGSWTDQ